MKSSVRRSASTRRVVASSSRSADAFSRIRPRRILRDQKNRTLAVRFFFARGLRNRREAALIAAGRHTFVGYPARTRLQSRPVADGNSGLPARLRHGQASLARTREE
ncbi:hypothetical protein CBM2588_A40261 [Cupriavidus taiwanensis]|nr:hypothetical protein CBM2588_A40261 [Cupriavidus taiwanensis]SPA46416.1 hypothetical protein CBM2629_A50228 [Cupriavidus taiwanensis]